jgi:hypothetical protein
LAAIDLHCIAVRLVASSLGRHVFRVVVFEFARGLLPLAGAVFLLAGFADWTGFVAYRRLAKKEILT